MLRYWRAMPSESPRVNDVCEMLLITMIVLLGLMPAGAAAAETTASAPQCKKAEVNPVTGHVSCIDPLGAQVEAPPEEAKLSCKDQDVRGQWSYGPNCAPVPKGM
jgi:hypothetical protein